MSGTGRHASAPALWFPTRLGVTTAVAALVAVAAIVGAVAATVGRRANPGAGAAPAVPGSTVEIARGERGARAHRSGARALRGGKPAPGPPSTAPASTASPSVAAPRPPGHDAAGADRRRPPGLPGRGGRVRRPARHVTWLQANGKITFGPVQMEPGKPGGGHQTPRGTFHVEWKAGPSYVSNIYHEPMPWATFFASGGIAFHGGSLTAWSHGCVHLTDSERALLQPAPADRRRGRRLLVARSSRSSWRSARWPAQQRELVGEVRAGRVAGRAARDDEARGRRARRGPPPAGTPTGVATVNGLPGRHP